MSKVLIFAGTTEGRMLADFLAEQNMECDVCVATEYGNQLIPESDRITVHQGRLDVQGMTELIKETGCEIIVDATHPFAEVVTKTIKEAAMSNGILRLRLLRKTCEEELGAVEGAVYYDSIEQCERQLLHEEGKVLLTTGSKDLSKFTRDADLTKRLIVRVLPGMESLKLCYDNGLSGSQIICMQGPFSEEMNLATIRSYDIRHMVTKESGKIGGVDTKILAAKKYGAKIHIIRSPKEENESAGSFEEVIKEMEAHLGVAFSVEGRCNRAQTDSDKTDSNSSRSKKMDTGSGSVKIALIGIGCGDPKGLTKEAEEMIRSADYLFGAKRMLESVGFGNGNKYPLYKVEDIAAKLEQLREKKNESFSAAVLFSGDTGFYSGAKAAFDVFSKIEGYEVKLLPGISSIQLFSARLGIAWQDAKLLSFHGVRKEEWLPKFIDCLRYKDNMIFLTSGLSDIHTIGTLLEKRKEDSVRLYLGKNLSYPDEEVKEVSPEEAIEMNGDGLFVGAVISEKKEKRPAVISVRDEMFIRDKVPMTKEEIRLLSLSELRLGEGDVLYDIGCGTGSVSIGAALLSPLVRVFALDVKEEAVELTKKNIEKFDVPNVTVIKGSAPEDLAAFPMANAAFIGGSGGNLSTIMKELERINPNMRVVINAVSLETVAEMNALLETTPHRDERIIQVGITKTKKVGKYHMPEAANPIYIYSFTLGKGEEV